MADDRTGEPDAQVDPDRTRDAGAPTGPGSGPLVPAFLDDPWPGDIGGYRVIRVLGEGGMGKVYEAEQPNPKRLVALKVIRAGYLSAALLRRFEREAEVLGRLHHPGIAQVYEAGTAQTPQGHQPYFAMELIQGQPLTEYVGARKLSVPQRLELLIKICDAVQYAHQQGIIHRDLKPGNILVDEAGQPKILDFGIAKVTESDMQAATMQTDIGQLVGTLPYMSPEQAAGDPAKLDTRSDVYALGVIAYELMAGRLPLDLKRKMLAEAVRVIQEEEPTRLSVHDRHLRGDLETIVGKALEKDKTRRYQSASELAADIRRHLSDEPIAARPPSLRYQLSKFAKRNKALVAGLAAVFVALVLGVVGTTTGMVQARRQRAEAERQRGEAVTQRAEAVSQRTLAQDRAAKLAAEVEAHRRTIYIQRVQLAESLYRDANISVMEQTLAQCPKELRNWEWHRLRYVQDRSLMSALAKSQLWSIAWSQDGKKLAAGSEMGPIRVFDAGTLKPLVTLWGHSDPIVNMDFNADGTLLACASNDHTLSVWDVDNGSPRHWIAPGNKPVVHVAFSNDQKLLHFATWGLPGLGTMDVESGQVHTLPPHPNGYGGIAWSPDRAQALLSRGKTVITLVDTDTGAERWTSTAAQVKAASFSHDGKRIALPLDDGAISIHDSATGAVLMVLRKHEAKVNRAVFSPDDRWLASGSEDRTIRIWDTRTGEELTRLRGHTGGVGGVAWSPDGQRLATVGDNSIRVWDPFHTFDAPVLGSDGEWEADIVRYTADGRFLVTVSGRGMVWFLDAETKVYKASISLGSATTIDISRDSGRMASLGRGDGLLRFWDAATGKVLWSTPHAGAATSGTTLWPPVLIHPDGQRIYTIGTGNLVNVWNASTGQPLSTFTVPLPAKQIMSIALNPTGDLLAASSFGPVFVLDARSGATIWSSTDRQGGYPIPALAFSPDGSMLAAAGRDGATVLHEPRTGRVIRLLAERELGIRRAASAMIECLAWSPDGSRLVTGGYDNHLKIWDTATGALALTLRGHKHIIRSVAWSPDGKAIVSASVDGTFRLWDSGSWDDAPESPETQPAKTP